MNKMPIGLSAPLTESLTKFNQFVISQLEKGVALGLDSWKAYVDLGASQIRVALKVTDPHSLHEFADSQFAVLSFVGHRMLDDNRALNEWGMEGCNQAQRLARKNMMDMLLK